MRGRKNGMFLVVAFLLILLVCFAANVRTFIPLIGDTLAAGRSAHELQAALSGLETKLKDNVKGKNTFADLYGLTLRGLNQRIVGKFEFMIDDNGYMQRVSEGISVDSFVSDMLCLKEALDEKQVPLLYLELPEKARNLELSQSDNWVFQGEASYAAGEKLSALGINCLDIAAQMEEADGAPSEKEFYFKTDVHLTTLGEFWLAEQTVRSLQEQGVSFCRPETVFARSNYRIERYDFLGNLARSAGRFFAGTDCFEIYFPAFETDLVRVVPGWNRVDTGSFEHAVLNGYTENPHDIYIYIYWVRNYGQFLSPWYVYENQLAPNGPDVLVVCDSVFMRGFSYLALACRSVTVLDPRYFDGEDYLALEMLGNHYDAVVVVGISDAFYSHRMKLDADVLSLAEEPMISEAEYGAWIGRQGICIDEVNGEKPSAPSVIALDGESRALTLMGWAADFRNDRPFSALYIRAGDRLIPCQYGNKRESVANHFGKDTLSNTGFKVAIPAIYIEEADTLEFIGVSADGETRYEPVRFELLR